MKNTLKLVLAVAFVAFCGNVSAQNIKLAHIDLQELVSSMPENDSAMVKLQKFVQELENELELLGVERNRKYEDYLKNRDNLSDLVRRSREDELNQMNQRIEMFQQQAEQDIQQEQVKLFQPVYDKANKAVEAVAKEQGVTYVINVQALHYKATGTTDLLPAVKQHLGIKN